MRLIVDGREKLIELLDMNCGYVSEMKAEELADYLLENGVIVTETDPLPVPDAYFREVRTTSEVRLSIPFPPVTKKNSQRILRRGNGGSFIAPSAKYTEYERNAVQYIRLSGVKPFPESDLPVNVSAVFYMPTARRCDLVNLLQALDDVLVKAGVLPDDNYKVIAHHDGCWVCVDRENPRTEVVITETVLHR